MSLLWAVPGFGLSLSKLMNPRATIKCSCITTVLGRRKSTDTGVDSVFYSGLSPIFPQGLQSCLCVERDKGGTEMLEISPALPQHHHLGEDPVSSWKAGEGKGNRSRDALQCVRDGSVSEMAVCQRQYQALGAGRRLRKHQENRACGIERDSPVLARIGLERYGKDILGGGSRKAGKCVSRSWRAGINSCLWLTWQRWNFKWVSQSRAINWYQRFETVFTSVKWV